MFKRVWFVALLLSVGLLFGLCLSGGLKAASDADDGNHYNAKTDGLVVHEWGAIRYYENKGIKPRIGDLPKFVSKSAPQFRQMEFGKPVIYFYSPKARTMDVAVGVPGNSPIYHWPPGKAGPYKKRKKDKESEEASKGAGRAISSLSRMQEMYWKELKILAARSGSGMREVENKHWWAVARRTSSNILQIANEKEKFLMYESPDIPFKPLFRIEPNDAKTGFSINSRISNKKQLLDLFAVMIKNGKGKIIYKAKQGLKPFKQEGAIISMDFDNAKEFDLGSKGWKDLTTLKLKRIVEKAGLYADEATGMSGIWEEDFFRKDGMRVVYRLSEKEYNTQFPLYLSEEPKAIKRVMLIMIEN